MSEDQPMLFPMEKIPEPWEKEWVGMPEFDQPNKEPMKTLMVHFESEEGVQEFSKLVDQKVGYTTKYIWFPKIERRVLKVMEYISEPEKGDKVNE